MPQLLPLFLELAGRRVLLVGGGPVAAAKLHQLLAVDADVKVVAPDVCEDIERTGVAFERRAFETSDLDGVWLVVAAGPADVNKQVAAAAEERRIFVNAVDDPAHATAYLGGVVRRDGVTLAISTSGDAPALAGLLREGLDAVLPRDLGVWLGEARLQRVVWRRDGVPMNERRPLLLEALNRLYADRPRPRRLASKTLPPDGPAKAGHYVRSTDGSRAGPDVQSPDGPTEAGHHASTGEGHVTLVGAGPGDPGLLTRRAVARLRAADLVLYDALVDRRILKFAPHAQRFFVGKRAGRHAMTQPAIHALMIRAARKGKRVVRLKGGDPFVFGRGGEEVLALHAAGVRVDVVPGVSSATAAPALAGIPVTHRGMSSAFLVVGGHDEAAFASAVLNVRPNDATLVVLMGMARRAALSGCLIDAGWAHSTPAAIVVDASKREQAVWFGTLEQLASAPDVESEGPATIVIGAVVALAAASGAGVDEARVAPAAGPR